MIETTPEGYKILIGSDGSRIFMIDSNRIHECIEYIKSHDLRFIGINSYMGYKKSDISFLSELVDFVEGITIPEDKFDISVVNDLHKLKKLGFADNKKTKIDLSNFPNLSTLACEYSPRLFSLEVCEKLRSLTLTGYKVASKNLVAIPSLSSLEELDLFVTNIGTLDGIERFKSLEKLTLFRTSQLQNIDSLRGLKKSLTSIEFDQCKKIQSYEVLGELENLQRLLLFNCHQIPSLTFLKPLKNLKFFSFVNTNVLDGDLYPAVGIEYVGFDNKRHYSHRFDGVTLTAR